MPSCVLDIILTLLLKMSLYSQLIYNLYLLETYGPASFDVILLLHIEVIIIIKLWDYTKVVLAQ